MRVGQTIRAKRSGFTLLELLVVVAILAIVAGSLIVAYEGLAEKSAHGAAAFNIGDLDSAVRTFAVVNGTHPDGWDSLLYRAAGDGSDSSALNVADEELWRCWAHTL